MRVRAHPRTRRRSGLGILLPFSLVAAVLSPALLGAQGTNGASRQVAQGMPRLTVTSAALSADTIGIGDLFQLDMTILLAPRSVAFLPDSILGSGFEPFGPVEWAARVLPDGSTELSVTYPLIAFNVGTVTVPEFEVFAADAAEGVSTGMAPADAAVGDFESFVENVDMLPSARLRSVPPLDVWVGSVLILEDQEYGIVPRPPADVAGRDRNWPTTALTLLFGLGFFAVSAITLRDWSATRATAGAPPPVSPRDAALAALDRLVAEGGHLAGDPRDFFASSSEIVRRYVETFDGRWGPAWTSTELMRGLGAWKGTDPMPVAAPPSALDSGPLAREMDFAEGVKFGGVRPDPETAERHVRTMRAWIAAAPHEGGEA
jgi:hypothetical protein